MDKIENTSSIEFEYKINPAGPSLEDSINSNTNSVDLILGELSMVKNVDKAYATIGDILTYTIAITNVGNVLASNIVFKDIVGAGATFVSGSVTVDSVSQPTYDPNTGFNLGSLLILGSKTVTFQVEVTSLEEPNVVSNQATTTFQYLVVLPVGGSSSSNTVSTTINVMNVTALKTASAEAVAPGDNLTYTIVIMNNGNIDVTNVEFLDTVPPELTFVSDSVTIDSTPQPGYDPSVGFSLGTIPPNSSVTVGFTTTVN